MADTFAGTLYTKRHAPFTVTLADDSAMPGSGQGADYKKEAPQTEVRVAGVLVNRSTAPAKETLTLKWVFTSDDAADIANFVPPAIDEVVTVAGLNMTHKNGDWNVKDWGDAEQEGNDLTGTCVLIREGGAALPALA